MDLLLLGVLAVFAGFVDAIVGGGGLIQLPALFGFYPGVAPAMLLGTNKTAAIAGTAVAAARYLRRVPLPWAVITPAIAGALVFSFLGAQAVAWLPRDVVRPLVLGLLIAVAAYTFVRKDFGAVHAPRRSPASARWLGLATGATLGFYDGFFGPGTGSLFVFLFVRLLGYDFLNASASAKLLNTATNASALLLFAWKGHVWWHLALLIAVANVGGSLVGTRLALRHGAGFVRGMFIVVVAALIAKTAYDAFLR